MVSYAICLLVSWLDCRHCTRHLVDRYRTKISRQHRPDAPSKSSPTSTSTKTISWRWKNSSTAQTWTRSWWKCFRKRSSNFVWDTWRCFDDIIRVMDMTYYLKPYWGDECIETVEKFFHPQNLTSSVCRSLSLSRENCFSLSAAI